MRAKELPRFRQQRSGPEPSPSDRSTFLLEASAARSTYPRSAREQLRPLEGGRTAQRDDLQHRESTLACCSYRTDQAPLAKAAFFSASRKRHSMFPDFAYETSASPCGVPEWQK